MLFRSRKTLDSDVTIIVLFVISKTTYAIITSKRPLVVRPLTKSRLGVINYRRRTRIRRVIDKRFRQKPIEIRLNKYCLRSRKFFFLQNNAFSVYY